MVESPTNLSDEERDALIVRLLEQNGGPLATTRLWNGLPRALRGSRALLEGRLAALVDRGLVFRWPQGRFAARPLDLALAEALVAAVATPLPLSEVVRRVARRVRGAGEKRTLAVLRALVQERRVFRHPPPFKARSARFGAEPPEVADYVEPHLSQLVTQLAKKGFAEVDVRAALARALGAPAAASPMANGVPDEQAMLDMIGVLDPQARQGALVYIPHLRNALAHRLRDKASFDRVVLALAAQRRVQVQAHPVPAQLSAAEREAMVPDGVGGVYMAIGLSAE
jgi:hypothetical protein